MSRPVIQIEVRSVYGVLQAYPANEPANLLAQIAGTKTLKHETLALAERMGFSIEQMPQQQFRSIDAAMHQDKRAGGYQKRGDDQALRLQIEANPKNAGYF